MKSEREHLENRTVQQFSFLSEAGLRGPSVDSDVFATSFSWLGDDIGVEVELEAREGAVFVLLVRLQEGRMPRGYYVDGGSICRIHVETAAQKRGRGQDVEIRRALEALRATRGTDPCSLEGRVMRYAELVRTCLSRILQEKALLFSE